MNFKKYTYKYIFIKKKKKQKEHAPFSTKKLKKKNFNIILNQTLIIVKEGK